MKKKKIFVCLPLRLQPILQYQILGWMHGSYMLEEPEEHQVLSKNIGLDAWLIYAGGARRTPSFI